MFWSDWWDSFVTVCRRNARHRPYVTQRTCQSRAVEGHQIPATPLQQREETEWTKRYATFFVDRFWWEVPPPTHNEGLIQRHARRVSMSMKSS